MSLASVLEAGAGKLGVRFFLVGLVPTAGLGLFIAALVWSGAPAEEPNLDRVAASIADLNGGEGLVAFVGVMVAALLLEPLQLAMVRVLEGYWGESGIAGLIARPLCAGQRRRRCRLEGRTQTETAPSELPAKTRAVMASAGVALRRRYPAASRLQPTALGNALRAAEDRVGTIYGLDAVTVWPRLYPLLAPPLAAGLDSERNQLDLAVRMVWMLAAATAAALAFLFPHGWWLLVPIATSVLAALAYRGAVGAAVAYGGLIQVAFELHRFNLLEALHCPLPDSAEAERELNQELSIRLLHGDWQAFRYTHQHRGEAR